MTQAIAVSTQHCCESRHVSAIRRICLHLVFPGSQDQNDEPLTRCMLTDKKMSLNYRANGLFCRQPVQRSIKLRTVLTKSFQILPSFYLLRAEGMGERWDHCCLNVLRPVNLAASTLLWMSAFVGLPDCRLNRWIAPAKLNRCGRRPGGRLLTSSMSDLAKGSSNSVHDAATSRTLYPASGVRESGYLKVSGLHSM
jgi:hypothetical protein